MLPEACAAVVADGALSCVVLDAGSGATVASAGHVRVDHGRILETLLGRALPANAFLRDGGRTSLEQNGEIFVLGPERAVFAATTAVRARLVMVVAPAGMSVALGWSLLRRVAAVAEAAA